MALPDKWQVVGVHSESYAANIYRVIVDVRSGRRSAFIDLMVTQFYPEEGEPYWKVRPLNRAIENYLHAISDDQTLRKLNDAKSEVDSLKSERGN